VRGSCLRDGCTSLRVLLGLVSSATVHDAGAQNCTVRGRCRHRTAPPSRLAESTPPQAQVDGAGSTEPWPSCAGPLPRRLRLSWFDAPDLIPGELAAAHQVAQCARFSESGRFLDYEVESRRGSTAADR
jgi:hypothetical protein